MRRLAVNATAAFALASALLATGCASVLTRPFQEPQVTFRGVRVNGIGLNGGDLDVVLNVYNPNGFALDATRFTYRLMIDTIPLGSGALDRRFAVPKRDSAEVRLPLSFSFAGLGTAARQLLGTGTVNYRVLGDITVDTPLGPFTRPYDRTGRFDSLRGAASR